MHSVTARKFLSTVSEECTVLHLLSHGICTSSMIKRVLTTRITQLKMPTTSSARSDRLFSDALTGCPTTYAKGCSSHGYERSSNPNKEPRTRYGMSHSCKLRTFC